MKNMSTTTPEPQPLLGFRTNEEWDDLLARVDGLVKEIEALPDLETRQRVLDLLQGIDAIHREGLTRLVRLFKEGVLAQVVTDPAIRTLMEFYDLLPQTAGGGQVPDFITGFPPPSRAKGPISEQRVAERVPTPHWVPVLGNAEVFSSSEIVHRIVEGRDLLLCKVGDEVFALAAACSQDATSLAGGTLNGYTLTCPSHAGCYYDVRGGKRIGATGSLECFSVKIDAGGRILVGCDMPFTPHLPSF
jgi:nitrite reductase/ring-hydroxylating ferredoxin subunit